VRLQSLVFTLIFLFLKLAYASTSQTKVHDLHDKKRTLAAEKEIIAPLLCPLIFRCDSTSGDCTLAGPYKGQMNLLSYLQNLPPESDINAAATKLIEASVSPASSEINKYQKLRMQVVANKELLESFDLDCLKLARQGGLEARDYERDCYESDSLFDHWVFKSKYFSAERKKEFASEIARLKSIRKKIKEQAQKDKAEILEMGHALQSEAAKKDKTHPFYNFHELSTYWPIQLRENDLKEFVSTAKTKTVFSRIDSQITSVQKGLPTQLREILEVQRDLPYKIAVDDKGKYYFKGSSLDAAYEPLCSSPTPEPKKMPSKTEASEIIERILSTGKIKLSKEDCEVLAALNKNSYAVKNLVSALRKAINDKDTQTSEVLIPTSGFSEELRQTLASGIIPSPTQALKELEIAEAHLAKTTEAIKATNEVAVKNLAENKKTQPKQEKDSASTLMGSFNMSIYFNLSESESSTFEALEKLKEKYPAAFEANPDLEREFLKDFWTVESGRRMYQKVKPLEEGFLSLSLVRDLTSNSVSVKNHNRKEKQKLNAVLTYLTKTNKDTGALELFLGQKSLQYGDFKRTTEIHNDPVFAIDTSNLSKDIPAMFHSDYESFLLENLRCSDQESIEMYKSWNDIKEE